MKKSVFTVIAVIASAFTFNANAQSFKLDNEPVFKVGNQQVMIGTGSTSTTVGTAIIPPVFASYEMGLYQYEHFVIGAGAEAEYSSHKDSYGTNSSMSVLAFAAAHYGLSEKIDVCARLGLGYGTYGNEHVSLNMAVRSVGFVGTYNFTDRYGAFVALDASSLPGKSTLRIGMKISL